jgi:nucleosome assembly protein 1-like 1
LPGAAGVFQNPALVSMIQGKLGTLIGRSSGYIESLPAPVKKRLTGLKGLQAEYSKLELKFQEEILELEKKYLEKYRPLYERRAEIVNGVSEPKDAEMEAGLQAEQENGEVPAAGEGKDEEETEAGAAAAAAAKGVPEFWLTAMKNMVIVADLITSKDEEVLRHLTDIRLAYLDVPGFRIEFEFGQNDFFTDKVLTKSYFYQQQAGYGGDFIYDHAEGEEIHWKEGKDLTVMIQTKRQRNKSSHSDVSFANWKVRIKLASSSEASLLIVSSTFSSLLSHTRKERRKMRKSTMTSMNDSNWTTISAKISRRS